MKCCHTSRLSDVMGSFGHPQTHNALEEPGTAFLYTFFLQTGGSLRKNKAIVSRLIDMC